MKHARVTQPGAALGIILSALSLIGCSSGEKTAAPAASPTVGKANVDGARIESADSEPGSWMSHGRTYSEQRYSPLAKINKENVGTLGLAWYRRPGHRCAARKPRRWWSMA